MKEIAKRHAAYCARFIPSATQRPSSLGNPDAPPIDDVRAALTWSLSEDGDIGVGIDLAVKSAPLFFRLSLLGECKRWAERAMSALPDSARDTELELVLLEASAISAMFTRGNTDDVKLAIERALALERDEISPSRQGIPKSV